MAYIDIFGKMKNITHVTFESEEQANKFFNFVVELELPNDKVRVGVYKYKGDWRGVDIVLKVKGSPIVYILHF